jgi:hypothetical protein
MVVAFALMLVMADPPGPLVLPSREPKPVPSAKALPRPRIAPPRSRVKPPTVSQQGLAESLGLEARPDGGYTYTGEKQERFDAVIRRDGVVEFALDPTVTLKVEGICVAAICTTRLSKKARRDEKRKKTGVKVATIIAEVATGRLSVGRNYYGQPVNAPPFWGWERPPFSAGAIQGRYGHLPTPAAAMQEFMDRTYELRVEMALSAGLEDLEAARKRLPTTLLRVWRDETRTLAERRAAILEMWDDLDRVGVHADPVVAGDTRLEDRRRTEIAAARKTILAFVRRHAPAGSSEAFTQQELDAFNERPGVVLFAPY